MVYTNTFTTARTRVSPDPRRLAVAVTLSFLAHTALILTLRISQEPLPQIPIKVSLVKLEQPRVPADRSPLPPPPAKQIVSPSEAKQAPPPAETRLLSDRDSTTPKEQLKRGEGERAGQPKAEPAPAKKISGARVKTESKTPPQAHALAPKTSLPKEGLLRLDESTIQRKVAPSAKAAQPENPQLKAERAVPTLENYHPFQKGAVVSSFTGPSGTPDYLPNIPDGDITLLNAKADRFAVFVRRVALQVFGSLRQRHWQQLSASQLTQLRDYSTVEAVMSREGKLLRASVVGASGSDRFDQVVLDAAKSGAWDQNPPPAAVAEDGKIHFIFTARTWSRRGGGTNFEQRWLLLGTALR